MNEMNNNIPQLNSEGQPTGMAAGANSSTPSVAPTVQNVSNIPNVQGVPNVQNASNIPNVQGIPNVQNASNIPNVQGVPNVQNASNIPNVQGVPNVQNVQNTSSLLNSVSSQPAANHTGNATSPMNADPGMNLANHLTSDPVPQPINMTPSATLGSVTPNLQNPNDMMSNTSGGGNGTSSGNGSASSLMKEPSVSNNAPKKTKSPLFAVFVFLIIGGFIFGLPYINEYKQAQETKKQQAALEEQLRKEEEEQQKAEEERQEALEEEKKIKTSICTSPASNQGTFTLNQTQTFEYKEDKILTVSVATSRTYLQEDAEYEAMKLSCQTQADPLTTPSQEGYSVDCEIDNLTITLTESYDLETFETFTTSTGETKVAPYRYQQSFSEVQKTLEASQTVCK